MKNYYFTIANMVFKQGIGIPMGAGSIPFWGNLFPYISKDVQNLRCKKSIRTFKYHAASQLMDKLCTINDVDEL